MPNSRQKGARGEREFAALLTEQGYPARRGQQFAGGPDSPDVVCPDLDGLHFEVKRTERLSIYKAMQQAKDDKRDGTIPVVAHKKNRENWLIVLEADDFFKLISQL